MSRPVPGHHSRAELRRSGRGLGVSAQGGQAITEFALLAPLVLIILALIFTGSQYMDTVVGMNGAARAGAIIASNYMTGANGSGNQATALDKATEAVNAEWGLQCNNSNCFAATSITSPCSPSAATPGCVWVDDATIAPSSRHIETVHVSYRVSSYISFVGNLSVAALAGAEHQ